MNKTLLLACDRQQSLLRVEGESFTYTAYGFRRVPSCGGLPGFNGELPEERTGHYLLGKGYRAYNPTLMRFHGPDSWSPFGKGGLNGYGYCLGDPLNLRDPSGHVPLESLVGVLGIGVNIVTLGALTPLAITGMVLGVASLAVEVTRHVAGQQADPLLGRVGMLLGALSVGAGMAGLARVGVRAGISRVFRSGGKPLHKTVKLEVSEFERVTRQVQALPVSSFASPMARSTGSVSSMGTQADNVEDFMTIAERGQFVRMPAPEFSLPPISN